MIAIGQYVPLMRGLHRRLGGILNRASQGIVAFVTHEIEFLRFLARNHLWEDASSDELYGALVEELKLLEHRARAHCNVDLIRALPEQDIELIREADKIIHEAVLEARTHAFGEAWKRCDLLFRAIERLAESLVRDRARRLREIKHDARALRYAALHTQIMR
jgi:hypothetical protein